MATCALVGLLQTSSAQAAAELIAGKAVAAPHRRQRRADPAMRRLERGPFVALVTEPSSATCLAATIKLKRVPRTNGVAYPAHTSCASPTRLAKSRWAALVAEGPPPIASANGARLDERRAGAMAEVTFIGAAPGTQPPLAHLFAEACHAPDGNATAIHAAHHDVLGGSLGLALGTLKRTKTPAANSPNQLSETAAHAACPRGSLFILLVVQLGMVLPEARLTVPLAVESISRLRWNLGSMPVNAPAKSRLRITRGHTERSSERNSSMV